MLLTEQEMTELASKYYFRLSDTSISREGQVSILRELLAVMETMSKEQEVQLAKWVRDNADAAPWKNVNNA